MHNFARAFRIAFQHKMNVFGILVSGLAVALLWGGNLTAVFPVVDVIMTNRSLPEWVDDQLAACEAEISSRESEIDRLNLDLSETTSEREERTEAALQEAEMMLHLHQTRRDWYAWGADWIHDWLPTTPFQTLLVVCGFVATGTLLKSLCRIVNTILVSRLGYLVGFELRKDFYRQMLRLDLKNFSDQGRGDLMNRCTTDLNWVSAGVELLCGQAILEPLKMIVCLGIAAFVSWRLLLLTLIVAPIAGLLIRWLAKALKRAHRRAMQELSVIYDTLAETLGAIKLIKAFTMEPAERSRFHQSAKLYYHRQLKTASYNSLVSPTTELLGVMMIVMAAMAGGYLVLGERTHILGIRISNTPLTHGWMSIFFAMLAGMSDPARRLSNMFNHLQQASAASDRVFEVLDREPEIQDPPEPKSLPQLRESIRFENVDFSYDIETPILRHIDLEIRAGETLAIVGPNGCGKSTLLNLVGRFYDPSRGRLLFDGIDFRDVRLRDLRSRIGLVSQESLLMNDTVRNNILYGSTDKSDAAVEEAAKQAYAHQFIVEKLTDGYETEVGPGGNRLSGGQRQRIALARAILRDPEILILDEATSQVDLESEQLIHQVLEEFLRARTALVVTHRMSTICLADRIVVIEHGEILDVGTHEELNGRCELYRRLCHLGLKESA